MHILEGPDKPKLDLPDNIPVSDIPQHIAPLPNQTVDSRGTVYERDEQTGQIRMVRDGKKVGYRTEAEELRTMVGAMMQERNQLRDILLELCLRLEDYGFKCKHGELANCDEFMQIMSFAKGQPHITRPPLETMPLDGTRGIKRTHKEKKSLTVFLECGHDVEMADRAVKKLDEIPQVGKTFPCPLCISMLKERGMYEA